MHDIVKILQKFNCLFTPKNQISSPKNDETFKKNASSFQTKCLSVFPQYTFRNNHALNIQKIFYFSPKIQDIQITANTEINTSIERASFQSTNIMI